MFSNLECFHSLVQSGAVHSVAAYPTTSSSQGHTCHIFVGPALLEARSQARQVLCSLLTGPARAGLLVTCRASCESALQLERMKAGRHCKEVGGSQVQERKHIGETGGLWVPTGEGSIPRSSLPDECVDQVWDQEPTQQARGTPWEPAGDIWTILIHNQRNCSGKLDEDLANQ